MAPHSSQSSAPSPSLKRKQATISSFFGGKSSQRTPSETPTATQEKRPNKRPASPEPKKQADTQPEVDEDDDDDFVVPPSKRARVTSKTSPKDEDEDEEAIPVSKEIIQPQLSQPSEISSQRTEIFKFQSSPAVSTQKDDIDTEDTQRKKEKEKLHQKFVRKLGGADCMIGIGRTTPSDVPGAADAEEGDEEDEPAPPPTKGGKAGKKGGSKLTPMEKQVIEIKRKHLDTVLVVEVGYKFRFFGEDARTAAKELGIVCIPGKFRFDEREWDDLSRPMLNFIEWQTMGKEASLTFI